jgi:hypothetical protein
MCKHCEFLYKTFDITNRTDTTTREYWLFTEMFVYLHDGKDYCTDIEFNKNKIQTNILSQK